MSPHLKLSSLLSTDQYREEPQHGREGVDDGVGVVSCYSLILPPSSPRMGNIRRSQYHNIDIDRVSTKVKGPKSKSIWSKDLWSLLLQVACKCTSTIHDTKLSVKAREESVSLFCTRSKSREKHLQLAGCFVYYFAGVPCYIFLWSSVTPCYVIWFSDINMSFYHTSIIIFIICCSSEVWEHNH